MALGKDDLIPGRTRRDLKPRCSSPANRQTACAKYLMGDDEVDGQYPGQTRASIDSLILL
jgi:hypothetical protein